MLTVVLAADGALEEPSVTYDQPTVDAAGLNVVSSLDDGLGGLASIVLPCARPGGAHPHATAIAA